MPARSIIGAALPRAALLLSLLPLLAACEDEEVPVEHRIVGADPDRGREVMAAIECGVCHEIPGILGADGIVGPSLEQFGRRKLIAGVVPNEPSVLAQWVRDAPSLAPQTGMPDLPITQDQARDVAAYLYTLR